LIKRLDVVYIGYENLADSSRRTNGTQC